MRAIIKRGICLRGNENIQVKDTRGNEKKRNKKEIKDMHKNWY